jgi:hypothetical protein
VTAAGPPQPAPGARPEAGKQRQDAATAEPQHRDGRPPTFAIEIWASPQLREQNPGRALSLSEALEAGHQPAAHRDREPHPELEIEP